ncbi:MAG: AAA family ATPase [Spirochaetales bacterium]|nr:AAA family ATPase [Spirochaetales bacterium]
MILSSLEVASFGALVSMRLELQPGMNVILGPNEAGKSTLFKALQHLLLTPVHLNKRSFQQLIGPLLPVGGGDTVSCTLEFQVQGQRFRLAKSWGADAWAELHLPDGARITREEAVEARLLELLPVRPGTLRNVLLTYQSGLPATMADLEADRETVHGLSDLLHRGVLDTDGVSVGRFQEALDSQCQEYLRHWDLERGRPERKRGADSRWARDRGTVLEAFYALEDGERRYREISEKEASFGRLTEQLDGCARELARKEATLESVEPAARAAEQRSILEARLKETELSLKAAQNDYEAWTRSLLRSQDLEKELPRLRESVRDLDREKTEIQRFQEKRELVERLERIRAKGQLLQQAEAELESLPPLPRDRLEQLRQSASSIERLQASLKAGNLSLSFRAHQAIDLATQRDMDSPEKKHLPAGKELILEASGKIELRHADWNLEVFSGEGQFKAISVQYEQARSRHEKLLAELNVCSLEEAQQVSKRYEDQRSRVQTAGAVYKEELGDDTVEALEQACGLDALSPPGRRLDQVLEELVQTRSRCQAAEAELEESSRTVETLSGQYANRDKLLDRIAELGGTRQQLSEKSTGLAPLPEGYADAQSLLDHYDRLKQEVDWLRRDKIRLESDCRNAEASLPDESSEEARRRMEDLREQFERQVSKAEVLVRIREAARALLAEVDDGVYEPFTTLVARYLAALSDNRYRNVPPGAALPSGVIRGDGRVLSYDLLSAGTKNLFALAVRLAMAEFFLGQGEGFLVLDDPLVDLDPQRQSRAAEALQAFAGRQQLLIFTCQPAHAALLGEAHIELERT